MPAEDQASRRAQEEARRQAGGYRDQAGRGLPAPAPPDEDAAHRGLPPPPVARPPVVVVRAPDGAKDGAPSLLGQIGTVALVTAPFWIAVLLTRRRFG
jgi:hypothetical protein